MQFEKRSVAKHCHSSSGGVVSVSLRFYGTFFFFFWGGGGGVVLGWGCVIGDDMERVQAGRVS